MRKLLILAVLLLSLNAIGQTNYSGNAFTARSYMNSPIYKLNGVSLDSLPNASNRGFLTTWQYNKLMAGSPYPGSGIALSTGTGWGPSIADNSTNWNTAYNWGDHAFKYIKYADSVLIGTANGLTKTGRNKISMTLADSLHPGALKNTDWTMFYAGSLKWTNTGSSIWRNSNVGIKNEFPAYTLDVNGTSRFGTSSNHTSTEADGTLVFTGDATVFDDIMGPFSTGQNGAAGYPPFVPDSSYYTFTLDTTSASICKIYFSIQLPHSYKEGSNIYPHIHYKQEGATTPVFKVKYKWVNAGGSIQTGWKWYTMATSTGTTDKTSQLLYNANGIDGTGKTVSSIIYCQVYMSTVAAGRSTTNAYQFDIHFEKDAIGSRTTLSK